MSRAAILALQRHSTPVHIPEWQTPGFDGTVYVLPLSLHALHALRSMPEGDPHPGLREIVILAGDAQGQPLFTLEDIESLRRLPSAGINRLLLEIRRVLDERDHAMGKESQPTGISPNSSTSASLSAAPRNSFGTDAPTSPNTTASSPASATADT